MRIVAGPSGAGKSTAFPVAELGIDSFNVDVRCAELNGGSYQNVSAEVRSRANRELEAFIESHIRDRRSFAFETTLRSETIFDHARAARAAGFVIDCKYVALKTVEEHIKRVTARGLQGGHSAPPQRLREIHEASLHNVARALEEFDRVRVYDNTSHTPEPVLRTRHGRIVFMAEHAPQWLQWALRGTQYEPQMNRWRSFVLEKGAEPPEPWPER